MEPVFLAIDLGTSRCKVALFEMDGTVLSVLDHPIESIASGPGRVEQSPDQWWSAVCTLTRRLASTCDLNGRLAGISVTGQMHVLVPLARDGTVVGPAITLMDRRAEAECGDLEARISLPRLYEITGARLGPYAPLPKLMWLQRHAPTVLDRADVLLPCKDYLRFLLTGRVATEPVDAAGTLLYDIASANWSEEICEASSIPPSLLPRLAAPADLGGTVRREAARATGLPEGTPVAVGAGDDVAFLAAGVVSHGQAYEDLGSTASFLACVDEPVWADDLALDRYPHVLPKRWLIGGATSTAGAALDWASSLLGSDLAPRAGAPIGPVSDVPLLFLPYLEGARSPLWNSHARGVFFGLTSSHRAPHLVRAVKEGVAFALRDLVESLRRLNVPLEQIFSVGGLTQDQEWARIRATVYGQPTFRVHVTHGSCLGSAMLAAAAVGAYRSVEAAVDGMRSPCERIEPLEEGAERYDRLYSLHRKLYEAVRPLYSEALEQQIT